jgi:hypothetical protein
VTKLGADFPLSQMLVVDLLHEFELGVWKAIFTHLLRILYTVSPIGDIVDELDKRWALDDFFYPPF